MSKIKPLHDRVLVKPSQENEVTNGGIIIPDTAKEKPQRASVVSVGTGKTDDNGKTIPFIVNVGDTVLIPKYGGTEIKIDGDDYLVLREDDIIATINS